MKNDAEVLNKPILLFGMPRSGTSWLGKMFDSHPDVFYRHEPDSWQRMNWMPLIVTIAQTDQYHDAINQYTRDTLSFNAPKVASKMPVFKKSYYSDFRYYFIHLGIYLSKIGERVGLKLPVIGLPGGEQLYQTRLAWKSIESLGRLAAIKTALEGSVAIQIVRHPCGYIASVMRGEASKYFDDNRPTSEDYGILKILLDSEPAIKRGLTLKDMKACSPVERQAWRWVLYNENAYSELKDHENYKILYYDDFCKDPVSRAKEFIKFAGLDWSKQTENYLNTSTTNENNAYYSVYKDPLVAANKWKKLLSEEDIEQIMAIVLTSEFAVKVLHL